jgi:hypothetical protein
VNGGNGASGGSGTSGSNGTSGSSGVAGGNGANGSNGSSGVSGTSGSSGAGRSSGVSGTSGSSGVNGANGSSGVSGVSGANGGNGVSGGSGVSGANGAAGAGGTSGTSGSSGVSGANGSNTSAPSSQALCGGCNNASVYDCQGGSANVLCTCHSFVASGFNFVCQLAHCSSASGYVNGIYCSSASAIGGGYTNRICACTVATSNANAIGGGGYNCILCANCSAIAGGKTNQIANAPAYAAILGGYGNFSRYSYTVVMGNNQTAAADYTTSVEYLVKQAGAFKIPHPDPSKNKTHELWHTFVEAPTKGENIYRFRVKTTNCVGTIELPDYYKYLNNCDQVHVSPIDIYASAYAYVNDTQTQIDIVSNEDGEFDLFLFGTRKDNYMFEHWKGAERIIDDNIGED